MGEGFAPLTSTSLARTKFGAQLQCVTGPQTMLGEVLLQISYGGSLVPNVGATFTYRENPVVHSFEPLRSFVRYGLLRQLAHPGGGWPAVWSLGSCSFPTLPLLPEDTTSGLRAGPVPWSWPGTLKDATFPSPSRSGGRSINVTGQGFSLIQNFAMVVIAEPLQSWGQRREAGPLQPVTVRVCLDW